MNLNGGEAIMGCSDPRLTYLNSYGYNVVKLPRAGIEPLQVIGKDHGSLEDLGPLSTIWQATSSPPALQGPNVAASVNGQKTDDLKLSVGLDILASVLQGMGAASPKVAVAYTDARSVQFTFANVTETVVMPLDVGHYLSAGDLDSASPFASYFLDHEKQAFVITSVLKSNSITVTAKQDSGTTISVDIPVIEQIVGANVSVGTSSTNNGDITFKGAQPLTFGFKVFGITYGGGHWQVYGQPASGGSALGLGTLDSPGFSQQPILVVPGALLSELPKRA
jgi:hypothetical protein